jgi:hypothetical protein
MTITQIIALKKVLAGGPGSGRHPGASHYIKNTTPVHQGLHKQLTDAGYEHVGNYRAAPGKENTVSHYRKRTPIPGGMFEQQYHTDSVHVNLAHSFIPNTAGSYSKVEIPMWRANPGTGRATTGSSSASLAQHIHKEAAEKS